MYLETFALLRLYAEFVGRERVTKYQHTPSNIPEEGRSQLLQSGSLKRRKICLI